MKTSFQRAIVLFPRKDRQRIEDALLRWAREPVGVTVASNLRDREHFLPRRHMHEILRLIGSHGASPVSELQSLYQNRCYQLQRKGGAARIKNSGTIVLGRAVDVESFAIFLKQNNRTYLPSLSCALDFIQRLKTDPGRLSPREREILMAAHNAWVTWDEEDPSRDPFGFMAHDISDEVRASLGLDERIRGPLLLLRYEAPKGVRIHRATIADAGLFKYFSPPLVSQKDFGYTRPWERLALSIGGRDHDVEARPRPEAVHRPLKLSVVTKPPVELP